MVQKRLKLSGAKKLYFDRKFTKYSKNIKQTWSVIREIIGTNKIKDHIPNFFKENDEIISEYFDIENGFNNFLPNWPKIGI